MNKNYIPLFFWLILMIFTSCVSTYNALQPSASHYNDTNFEQIEGLVISPSADTILFSNKVFRRKAEKKGIKLVSIKIENRSSEQVILTRDNLDVFNNYELVELLSPSKIASKIGYNMAGRSALFALCVAGSFQIGSATTGLINLYSPFLYSTPFSLFYLTRSAVSNKKFKVDLTRFGLETRIIEPGETTYCILAFKAREVGELLIRVKK
jgi:hypothetical protein